jgi:hypothetical protein
LSKNKEEVKVSAGDKLPKIKKEVENIEVIDLKDVIFSTLVGQGAFGKVRKCYVQKNFGTSEQSTSSDEGHKSVAKRVMAVKILSKY